MRVLVACEESGTVRDAFRARGHTAFSCDILAADGDHLQGDVLPLLRMEWDLVIAHPPCTYLANSGVRHLHTDAGRWRKLHEATAFFMEMLNANCERVAVENPIPHKYGGLPKYSQIVQPWMFGHMEAKATCLWLKGLPDLTPTNNVRAAMAALPKGKRHRIHYMSPGPERSRLRSKTFQGIADAMAEQWGVTE